MPLKVHAAQISRAESRSPRVAGARLSGKVHAASYAGTLRDCATVVTLRNVQRRSGAAGVDGGRMPAATLRAMIAMAAG
jgi:hypothetical protein